MKSPSLVILGPYWDMLLSNLPKVPQLRFIPPRGSGGLQDTQCLPKASACPQPETQAVQNQAGEDGEVFVSRWTWGLVAVGSFRSSQMAQETAMGERTCTQQQIASTGWLLKACIATVVGRLVLVNQTKQDTLSKGG